MHRPSTRTIRRGTATTAALVAAAGIAAVAANPADAAVGHKPIHFALSGTNDQASAIVYGAVNGYGSDDQNHSDFDVLHLNGGSLRVTHPDSQSTFTPHISAKTCYGTFTLTGVFTTGHGTGRFANVHGSGHYQGTGTVALKRTKSGTCDENGEPRFEIFSVQASGHIH